MKFTERLKGYAGTAVGYLRNERGQTSLTEAAAAIAIGLTLAATLGPVVINVGDGAKVTRAKGDVVAMAKGMTSMFTDTKEWAVRETAGKKVSVPIGAGETAVTHLRSGQPGDVVLNPTLLSGLIFIADGIDRTADPEGGANLLNNHFVYDSASDACVSTATSTTVNCTLLYRAGGGNTGAVPTNWKGPYVGGEVNQDPWGHNYIVLTTGAFVPPEGAGAVTSASKISGVTKSKAQLYGWVLSAGPNGILETSETSSTALGDDIGVVFAVINTTQASTQRSQ